MTGRDMLVQQFGAIYAVIARNLDGLTHADSLAPAARGGNTANWILGLILIPRALVHAEARRVAFLSSAPSATPRDLAGIP